MSWYREKSLVLLCLVVVGGLALLATAHPAQEDDTPRLRVGIFDSRSITIAWIRSEAHNRSLDEIRVEYEAAKEAGNQARVDEIDTEMRTHQAKVHKQGFSIWPIRDILVRLEEDLPGIAAEAGVDVIVCRWDLAWRDSEAEFVDVTDLMVAPFDPDEQTLRILEQVKTQAPVSLEELEGHED